jgi:glycosyltransferase involved in cell wall biosynthesis
MRVALIPPPPDEPDAYLTLLERALIDRGVQHAELPSRPTEWIRRRDGPLDVVHLHWLEYIAPSDPDPGPLGAIRTFVRAQRLLRALRALQRRGVAVIWTVHNAAPHEPRHPRLERWLWRSVRARADAVLVHSAYARDVVVTDLPGPPPHIIPHGNYVDVYSTSGRSREQVRHSYGLPAGAFTYLAFGQIRAYKRIPELLEAFRELEDDAVALLIAGEIRDSAVAERVQRLAASDPRVRLALRRVPIEDVRDLHQACDAAVFPYARLFSSGAAVLALSMEMPIVVPAHSAGAELAGAPAVITFAGRELGSALVAVRDADPREQRRTARDAVASATWSHVAEQTIGVYEGAVRAARGRTQR